MDRDSGTQLEDALMIAARLSITPSQVYRLARRGQIPSHKLGRYTRFNLDEVLAATKQSQVQPRPRVNSALAMLRLQHLARQRRRVFRSA